MKNVVDSSGWLEFFADTERATLFETPILDTENLLVPTVSLYEVFKNVLRQRSESEALQAAAAMQSGTVVELTAELSIEAAALSVEHSLPMADAILLATAYSHRAELWTQDVDFEGLEGVRFFAR